MRIALSFLVASLLIAPAAAQDAPADDVKKLQGKWLLTQTERDGTIIRVVKQITGNQETVSVYRDGTHLVYQHTLDFEIKKTADVTLFICRNQRMTAGPNKGVVKEGPFSFLSQVKGNQWFILSGMLNDDSIPFRIDWFERVSEVSAAEHPENATDEIVLAAGVGPVGKTPSTSAAAEKELKQMQGEWTVSSLTVKGVEIPARFAGQSRVTIHGRMLTIDRLWWRVFPRPGDAARTGDELPVGEYPGRALIIDLHPEGDLKALDLTLAAVLPVDDEEPELTPGEVNAIRNQRIRHKGIYSLEGDELRICWGEWSGQSLRPTAFSAEADSNRLLLVLTRKKSQ